MPMRRKNHKNIHLPLLFKVADECPSVEEQERTARVFEGSDTLQAALAGIHDRHLDLIDAREADLRKHLQRWLADTLKQIQE